MCFRLWTWALNIINVCLHLPTEDDQTSVELITEGRVPFILVGQPSAGAVSPLCHEL